MINLKYSILDYKNTVTRDDAMKSIQAITNEYKSESVSYQEKKHLEKIYKYVKDNISASKASEINTAVKDVEVSTARKIKFLFKNRLVGLIEEINQLIQDTEDKTKDVANGKSKQSITNSSSLNCHAGMYYQKEEEVHEFNALNPSTCSQYKP